VLSVAIHEETGIVAATCPRGNIVTFWDLEKQEFIKGMELPWPTGVTLTLDRKNFVACYSKAASSTVVNVETLGLVPELAVEKAFLSGSHIIAHQIV